MELEGKTIGFAITGSFCTFKKVIKEMEYLKSLNTTVVPIMSQAAYTTDTRFGDAEEIKARIEDICGRGIISTFKEAEPIGPKGYLDLLIVAPCTGNSLAKLASGIADTSVTMAAKAHLRNQKPVLLAVSTNDGLANAAKNIGALLNYKNVFFVPFRQDDCINKPTSLVADMPSIIPAARFALDGKQIQPVLLG
ncbi:MAG: dipicolinate synthase subunit B [Eubacteriales bacterium]|nr:dipicolinate synthase subunit B [Eubacteriales bacterium]